MAYYKVTEVGCAHAFCRKGCLDIICDKSSISLTSAVAALVAIDHHIQLYSSGGSVLVAIILVHRPKPLRITDRHIQVNSSGGPLPVAIILVHRPNLFRLPIATLNLIAAEDQSPLL
ncbi:hypothetical protein KIN20_021253 [Parelaphostrongylus tenuis]|uniref:Uncharacterized protein n=1 Tax=Parelaphostrongylus tenuis TaxID=148309 RepID=A0AAD5QW25_PARTN|nr:hypothetical protein KIN20_021253 [Parelaphostrongylus tenuis]